jgi:hypothetical protein
VIGRSFTDQLRAFMHRGAPSSLHEAVCSALADQYLRLHQGTYALFEEQGIALGALDQTLLQCRQAEVIA